MNNRNHVILLNGRRDIKCMFCARDVRVGEVQLTALYVEDEGRTAAPVYSRDVPLQTGQIAQHACASRMSAPEGAGGDEGVQDVDGSRGELRGWDLEARVGR